MFREATAADRGEFLTLWTEFLKETEGFGGAHTPDRETLGDVRALFDAYVGGSRFGMCTLYEPEGLGPQGAGFCGEGWGVGAIRPQKWGRVAWGWGIYIRPEFRRQQVAHKLHIHIARGLKDLGFDTVVGNMLVGNEAAIQSALGADWRPHSITHIIPLGDWKYE